MTERAELGLGLSSQDRTLRSLRYLRAAAALAIAPRSMRLAPSNVISDVRLLAANDPANNNIENTFVRHHATVQTRSVPTGEEPGPGFTRALSDVVAAELTGVTINPRHGVCSFPDGRIVLSSSGSLFGLMGWRHVLPDLSVARGRSSHNQTRYLAVPSLPFFHLMTDALPGILWALESASDVSALETPPPTLLCCDGCPSYVIELCTILAELYDVDVDVVRDRPFVGNVVVPGAESVSGSLRPADAQRLHRFGRSVTADEQASGPVYVSRIGSRRSPINEPAAIALVESVGGAVLDSRGLSVRDQILFARNATSVIGPHGAGLTHVLWTSAGASLLELTDPSRNVDAFAWMAEAGGHRYDATPMHKEGDRLMIDLDQLQVDLAA